MAKGSLEKMLNDVMFCYSTLFNIDYLITTLENQDDGDEVLADALHGIYESILCDAVDSNGLTHWNKEEPHDAKKMMRILNGVHSDVCNSFANELGEHWEDELVELAGLSTEKWEAKIADNHTPSVYLVVIMQNVIGSLWELIPVDGHC